ncbi:fusaric acid resistance family protein [Isoptericola jiangsuensis]|uniref:Fusaric acid resistance family protein n=1 Tax=Isoptericola jiangsuensis TaxID=548579 RepID=A0A2A9EUI4_9MICO|nr:FUSC family protein [Isoptericola jiangsuensis]PFG41950.1 fusaric acid resistance family protein [Isoptericola jiangsuensis]
MGTDTGRSRPSLTAALRWDLTARLVLAVVVPPLLETTLTGAVSTLGATAALTALLVTFADLGPDLSTGRWPLLAAVATPVAVIGGTLLAATPGGDVLWAFVLFTVHGAMLRAGMPAQLAWFPVAAAGLLAALLGTPATDVPAVAGGTVVGAAWAALLTALVPRLLSAPRLDLPADALHVDTGRLVRMVRHPRWTDWALPLLLGGLAAALLLVADAATDGYRPYWAVFAMVGVLGPTAARTRRSTVQTVLATTVGIVLAVALTATGWPDAVVLGTAVAVTLAGALLLLASGTLSKTLTTPLPVLLAAAALGDDGALALRARLVEYLVGAAVGLVAAVAVELLARHLAARSPTADAPVA